MTLYSSSSVVDGMQGVGPTLIEVSLLQLPGCWAAGPPGLLASKRLNKVLSSNLYLLVVRSR